MARTAWALLRFGAPYTASLFVGTGVQFALPALILHILDKDSVGLYRAASSIAGVYLGFLLIAMAHDYYPRISAASDEPADLVRLVNQQHRLVMLLAVPMILGILAIAPYLVPLIYSDKFVPAVGILEWQLIGDLFKFSSWTMGFVILARSGSITLFLVELLAGANTLIASCLGIQFFDLAGLGIAYAATYAVHYVVTWIIVRKDIEMVWTAGNIWMLAGALLAALVVLALPLTDLAQLRTPVAIALAVLAGVGSLYTIWQEVGGLGYVRTRR